MLKHHIVEINTYVNKISTKFWSEKLKGIYHLENVYINGAIILKLGLNEIV
jgi:hypothetical protein